METNYTLATIPTDVSSNSSVQAKEAWQVVDDIAFDMETVYLWIILVLGLPGNCATIVTVTKMSPAKSLTVYIALLSVVDNLAIISKLLMFVLLDHKVHIGKAGCKLLGYLGNFLSTFANWLLVALSTERCAAVWFPMKVAQIWTFKKSTVTVSLIALVLSSTFLHLFWTMTFVDDMEADMVYCSGLHEYMFFLQHIWYWINVMIYATIPCCLLLIFNILIIIGIVRAQKMKCYLKGTVGENKHSSSTERHRQVTIMLVTAAITLVVLTTPRCVILILTPYYDPPVGTMAGSIYYLMDTVAFVLCDFNHAINFYVYSLSAKTFRNQFLQLIRCRHRNNRNNSNYYSLSSRQTERKTEM